MKKIYIVLLLVLSAVAFKAKAQVVLGPLKTNADADAYATHRDNLGQGGFRSVADQAEMETISPERRKAGMLVYVTATEKFYKLGSIANPVNATINTEIHNEWWVEVPIGTSTTSGGSVIFSGTGNPAAVGNEPATSKPGDYFFATDTKKLYGPKSATGWGTVSPLSGNTILSGAVAPDPGLGDNGDFYINTDITSTPPAPRLYGPKTAGDWGLATGLTSGPQGLPGPQGSRILTGNDVPSLTTAPNPKDGDYYFDTLHKLFYGPYNGITNVWPAGTDLTGGGQGPIGTPGVGVSFKGSFAVNPTTPALNDAYYNTTQGKSYIYNGTGWEIFAQDGTGGGASADLAEFATKTMTASAFAGFTPTGTTDLKSFINAVFYPSQSGTAGLAVDGAIYREVPGTATATVDFNWTAAKQGTSTNIKSVVITGNGATVSAFTGDDAGPLSGSISPSVPTNTSTTFTNTVTTQDDKKATATATVYFQWKRYYGFITSTVSNGQAFSPSDADILTRLTSEFATSAATTHTSTPVGNQRLVIAFPVSFDTPDIGIDLNTLPSKGTFERTTRVLTNSAGGDAQYVVYTKLLDTNASYLFEVK